MEIYEYSNYNEYVKAQTDANKRKISKIWVNKKTIDLICKQNPLASKILCHGTRNAAEQKMFLENKTFAEIIGTEISSTANDFLMTVQHDFMKPNADWIGYFDIVYSNSFDHNIDPYNTLKVWKNQLDLSGKLYIDIPLDENDNRSRLSDPLSITKEEIIDMAIDLGMSLSNTYSIQSSKQSGNKPCLMLEFT